MFVEPVLANELLYITQQHWLSLRWGSPAAALSTTTLNNALLSYLVVLVCTLLCMYPKLYSVEDHPLRLILKTIDRTRLVSCQGAQCF